MAAGSRIGGNRLKFIVNHSPATVVFFTRYQLKKVQSPYAIVPFRGEKRIGKKKIIIRV
ncbi:hypothetical protein [Desulfomarina profundi]|nr:hypothetical protein [Desulfomarina profundi]